MLDEGVEYLRRKKVQENFGGIQSQRTQGSEMRVTYLVYTSLNLNRGFVGSCIRIFLGRLSLPMTISNM
ncbi:hypothetical protein HYC85_023256 [Camellia sinensis]|uniref:Uncharacterized protein n=1 Tax=Camellia sinensis TaxID=4442 RepID=A0A7J7GEP8_CAMSI|nr:hypothetical protein HYC85_023256 [Camellia sinensis]